MHQRGFALLDALLALILMTIAAAGAYTLVKSFRANSATQQVIRYATNITQSFIPFLDANASNSVLSGDQLSAQFLSSIGVPTEDQLEKSGAACGGSPYCYVDAGMHLNDGKRSLLGFGVVLNGNQALANYFVIALQATASQVNQVLQNASSMFSVYCPSKAAATLSSQAKCVLQSTTAEAATTYSLFLVFPKSGDKAPANAAISAPSAV